MAEALFFDILPRFDWAASEAGQRRLIGQFDSAAKQISRTFGVEAGNAATSAVEKISADMRVMQDNVAKATTTSTENYRRMILAQGDLQASTLRVVEVTEKHGFESSQATAALARQEAATIKATVANDAYTASTARETEAVATATAAQARHAEALAAASSKAAAVTSILNTTGALAAGATALVVGATGKMAADFEQSQMRLVSSAGETREGMQTVSDGILKLAGTVGYSAEELSKGMYTVESAGYRGAEGIKVMTAAAQGAKAENADLSKVTDGLTTSMTDFGYRPEQAALVMSKLVTAVGESKANFEEFTSSLHSVEPAAASAHIGLDDVYGSLARITQSGTSADQATQNMADAIRHLQTATGPMRDEFAALHLDVNNVQDGLGQRGLAGTMQLISDTIMQRMGPDGKVLIDTLNTSKTAADDANRMFAALPPQLQSIAAAAKTTGSFTDFRKEIGGMNLETRNLGVQWLTAMNRADGFSAALKSGSPAAQAYTTALQKATGDVASMNVALQLTGPHAKEANDGIQKVAETTTDADGKVKGFGETQETLNAKLAGAKAGLGAAAIELGYDFIPALTKSAEALKTVAEFLAEHKRVLDIATIAIGGFAGAWLTAKAAIAAKGVWDAAVAGLGWLRSNVALTAASYDGLATSATRAAEAEAAAAGGAGAAGAAGGAAAAAGKGGLAAIPTVGGSLLATGYVDDKLNEHGVYTPDPFTSMWNIVTGNSEQNARDKQAWEDAHNRTPAPATDFTKFGSSQGPHGSRGALPPSAGPEAAADVADAARPDITAPGGGSLMPGSGGGSGSDATATGPNIDTNAPYMPVDVDPSHTPANMTYDQWIGDQRAVQSAQQKVTDTGTELATAQARQAELLKKGTATQAEWNSNAAALAKAQRENQQAMQDVTIAQNKAAADANTPAKNSKSGSTGMGETGSSILGGDFEFNPGGVGKFVTALLADLALGNPVGKQAAAERGSASNPMYVMLAGGGAARMPSAGMFGGAGVGGYPGDAALLANIPAGKYGREFGSDLTKGLGDCSSAVEDLVNLMQGRPTAGANMTTTNEADWLTAHGLVPTNQPVPGALNVGFNSGHTQATLPNGTPFNWGNDAVAKNGGVGGGGAWIPGLTSHYYLPPGATGVPALTSPSNTNPALNNPAAPSAGRDELGGAAGVPAIPLDQFYGGGGDSPVFRRPGGPVGPLSPAPGRGQGGGGIFAGPYGNGPVNAAPPQLAGVLPVGGPGQRLGGSAAGRSTYGGPDSPFGGPGAAGQQAPGQIGPFPAPKSVAGIGRSAAIDAALPASAPAVPPRSAAPAAASAAARPSSVGSGQQFGAGQSVGSGFSTSIGSTLASAASFGMGGMPGSAQAGKLVDRTIGYLGQLGGIAASGAMESLLPGGFGDKLAGVDKSWFGKLALGIAGAHKDDGGGGNRAGQSAPPADPGKDAAVQARAAAPAVPMPDQPHQGGGGSAGPGNNGAPVVGGDLVVNTTNGVDTDAMTRDLQRYQGGSKR